MPPSASTATTLSTVVPPVTATSRLNTPFWSAIVEALVVAEFASVFVAVTYTVLPAAVVPVTVTGDPFTALSSSGLETVSGVVPCV